MMMLLGWAQQWQKYYSSVTQATINTTDFGISPKSQHGDRNCPQRPERKKALQQYLSCWSVLEYSTSGMLLGGDTKVKHMWLYDRYLDEVTVKQSDECQSGQLWESSQQSMGTALSSKHQLEIHNCSESFIAGKQHERRHQQALCHHPALHGSLPVAEPAQA